MNRKSIKKLVSTLILGAAATFTQLPAQAADLVKDGQLTVGIEVAYPPFESWENGKIVGFDPELAALLTGAMNLKPEYIDTKFTNLILGLGARRFDTVISGMYITPERLEKASAVPYARTGAAILVLKDSPVKPQTEKDLCGLKVGLQQGTTWVKALSELSEGYCKQQGKGPVEIREFPTAPEVAQALMSRSVQAQMEIAGAAKMFTERSRGRMLISSPELVYPQTMGLYVRKDNPQLKQQIETAMAAIKADGSYDKLIKKYELTPVAD